MLLMKLPNKSPQDKRQSLPIDLQLRSKLLQGMLNKLSIPSRPDMSLQDS